MRSRPVDSILHTIGNTPVVRISRLAPPGVDLYAKLEAFNPLGSVKDRMALGVIEDAERSGRLRPGQTVVEATSGNTGIGLAMVCASKGYPLVVVMAENFSIERRKILRFLGARVVLTPASERGTGMLAKAVELAETHGWFLCRQFENEANARVHSETTAQEILATFEGERLDYWVTGFGTGGTLKGVARVLRQERPETRIVACEPDNSPMLASARPQPRNADGSPAASHPAFRTHPVQGWAPDFVPALAEEAREAGWIDEIVPVSGNEGLRLSRDLARREGIFTGISGGATLAGALDVCARAPRGATVLCMLPDTGERYLTTPLFDGIREGMDEEEIEISRSTPNHRFDVAPSVPVPAAPAEGHGDPAPAADGFSAGDAEAFVARAVEDPDQPVVMFALEYCEFCWSVRRAFSSLGVPYLSIDLDSQDLLEDDRGGKIREALTARTGSGTVPQVFVAGEFAGGCTEVIEALAAGRLQEKLEELEVSFDESADADPADFLPAWLQAR